MKMGPDIETDDLIFLVDPSNTKSYPGSGTSATDMIGKKVGALTSGATFENINGGVFDLDGVDDYINMGDHDDLEFVPSGTSLTREEVRTSRGAQNIQQAGTGIGYQQIGNDNTIT